MWRVIPALAASLAVVAAAQTVPRCEDPDACLRAIEARQHGTRMLSARFEQTKHLSLLAEPLVSRGRFAFKRPDQILWQLDDPPFTVRIDAAGVHLPAAPNADSEAAALAPFANLMREFSGMFSGSVGSLRAAFDVAAHSDAAGIHVHLVPHGAQWRRMFQSIDLAFAGPDLTLESVHLQEALGDSLDIVFSDIHRDDAVAAAAFAAGNER